MPSSQPDLVIPFAKLDLPVCNPNLMPFHINYSGPASVSAYMRTEKAASEVSTVKDENSLKVTVDPSAVEASSSTAQTEVDTLERTQDTPTVEQTIQLSIPATPSVESVESQTISVMSETTLVNESQTSLTSATSTIQSPPPLEDADKRFVSTFRGRTIHGLEIPLPPGYSGLVLQSEEKPSSSATTEDAAKSNKGKAADREAAPRPRGRLTRSAVSKRPEIITVEDGDVEMAAPEAPHDLLDATTDDASSTTPMDSRPVRQLVPKSQFSSFMLWHADRPVDKGNDEYFRTLTEWMSLAHEVSFFLQFVAPH
ncbi:hypothetical protein CVT26_016186 [Gymnopilus dilepis]|uniref:Uncharacterized protein n=1 Tax=Gymnopilus dilepis TaxID=231916 RepID=A0A409XZ22_9AGAR|nr:hypothetical protein CVT26_016186 [Gymnopilus dilepis]